MRMAGGRLFLWSVLCLGFVRPLVGQGPPGPAAAPGPQAPRGRSDHARSATAKSCLH